MYWVYPCQLMPAEKFWKCPLFERLTSPCLIQCYFPSCHSAGTASLSWCSGSFPWHGDLWSLREKQIQNSFSFVGGYSHLDGLMEKGWDVKPLCINVSDCHFKYLNSLYVYLAKKILLLKFHFHILRLLLPWTQTTVQGTFFIGD